MSKLQTAPVQSSAPEVMVVVGTRPEAIKLAPVLRELERRGTLRSMLVSTGQHRELLTTALDAWNLRPDHHLDVMLEAQTLNGLLARVLEGVSALLTERRPSFVVVQGDTTTVLGAALAAYQLRIPVAHVEAGLRTYDHRHPFPEEGNRQLVDRLSDLCFAPTPLAARHLADENIDPARVVVTGNTAVDAILNAHGRSSYRCPADTLLLTLHRRESFGGELDEILSGVSDFLDREPSARVLWPVHPNPAVRESAQRCFGSADRLIRVDPLGYLDFAGALASCRCVLTDSGGIQEEAPSFGKRVLVAREATERQEGLAAGTSRLVGRTRSSVLEALVEAWQEPPYEGELPAPNPFGDGRAASRIVDALEDALGQSQ